MCFGSVSCIPPGTWCSWSQRCRCRTAAGGRQHREAHPGLERRGGWEVGVEDWTIPRTDRSDTDSPANQHVVRTWLQLRKTVLVTTDSVPTSMTCCSQGITSIPIKSLSQLFQEHWVQGVECPLPPPEFCLRFRSCPGGFLNRTSHCCEVIFGNVSLHV